MEGQSWVGLGVILLLVGFGVVYVHTPLGCMLIIMAATAFIIAGQKLSEGSPSWIRPPYRELVADLQAELGDRPATRRAIQQTMENLGHSEAKIEGFLVSHTGRVMASRGEFAHRVKWLWYSSIVDRLHVRLGDERGADEIRSSMKDLGLPPDRIDAIFESSLFEKFMEGS